MTIYVNNSLLLPSVPKTQPVSTSIPTPEVLSATASACDLLVNDFFNYSMGIRGVDTLRCVPKGAIVLMSHLSKITHLVIWFAQKQLASIAPRWWNVTHAGIV